MRRSHWVLIPVLLIPIFIVWVVSKVDNLPQFARIGAYVIGLGAVLVFYWKQYQLERDLKNGEAEVVQGIVQNKITMGGSRRTSTKGGGGRGFKNKNNQATYIITIGGKKYWVQKKIYKKAEKGAYSEMVWLPKSQYTISLRKI